MKVAMVTGSYPPQPCGVGDYTHALVQQLKSSGLQVDVITTHSEVRRNCPDIRYELVDWKVNHWRKAADWIASQKYDIIHVQYPAKFYGHIPDLALLTSVLRRHVGGIPIVVTLHEFRVTHFLRKMTSGTIAQSADAVVMTAESERRAFGRLFWWMKDKLETIPLAIVIPTLEITREEKQTLRLKNGFGEQEILVAYFGFLHPNKGIEALLESFALVHREKSPARLVMLSLFEPEKQTYHAKVRNLVRALAIESAVSWVGFLPPDEVSRMLTIADIGLLPFDDGVSFRRLSFMTMLSHGVPTVTTVADVSLDELGLVEGESVIAVPVHSTPQQIAASVMRIIDSPRLRETLSNGGREWARPYQWDKVTEQTLDLYQALIAR